MANGLLEEIQEAVPSTTTERVLIQGYLLDAIFTSADGGEVALELEFGPVEGRWKKV